MKIRHRLIKARMDRSLKQIDVARSIGLAKSTYCEIEHGHHDPSWQTIQRLEQFFGLPASELLATEDEQADNTS